MAVETTALLTLDPPMHYLRFQPAPQPGQFIYYMLVVGNDR